MAAERMPSRLAALFVAAAAALHVVYAGLVPLSPQEAYYWQWSRHLDLSYFDHPPLTAWSIRTATEIFGHSERAVRLAGAAHSVLFCAFLFLAGRRLFGPRPALAAVAASLAAPIVSLGQIVVTPDGPLAAAWAAAFYCTVRALDEERGVWLLGAGAATGLAALSKYTGLLLGPQIGALLLLDARGRRLLRGPWSWLGLGLSACLFAPVLVWNAGHCWSSFAFHLDRLSRLGPFSMRRLGSFLGQQSLVVSPVLFAALAAAAVAAARRWREPAMRACAVFSLPLLAICLVASPFLWVKPNWPAPGWITALLAAAGLLFEARRERRTLAITAVVVAALSTAALHAAPLWPSIPMPARDDVTRGWPQLGARVGAELAKLPPSAFALGCSYWTASELAYYLPGRPRTYSGNALGDAEGLEYGVWLRPGELVGREGIIVLDRRHRSGCTRLAESCRPLEPLDPLVVRRGSVVVTTFELWRCRTPGTLVGMAR
jgi:4-amino-4-deoxy-L-arabinose transferase-like glycosyltransferase